MELTKAQQDLNYIIEILKNEPNGLNTKEVHKRYTERYGLKRDIATIRKRIIDLSQDKMELVTCNYIQGRNKKHTLKDNRKGENKSVISNTQLINAEREYLEVAMKMVKDLNNFSFNHYKLIEEKLNFEKEDSIYFTESQNLESIGRIDQDLEELKFSINNDNIIDFIYTAKSSQDFYTVEPYRLILIDGLWYLFAKDLDEKDTSAFKTWRIQYIKKIASRSQKYTLSNKKIDNLLSSIYSADFIVGEEEEFTIKIHPAIVEEFNFFIHLPGFKKESILHHTNGSISATALVSTYKDIEQDIKKWLPYIEIVEPIEHRDKLREELEEYLKNI